MANTSSSHNKWVVDRFEEEYAVLETSAGEIISVPILALPEGTVPGSTLINQNNKWFQDHDETTAREKRIQERFARIKANILSRE